MEKNNTQKGIVQFAMEAGAYMGLYFVVKFIFAVLSLNYPFCNVVSTIMLLFVPLVVFFMMRRFSNQNEGGSYFSQLWMMGILLFFFASLISGLAQYIYYVYINPEYIKSQLSAAVTLFIVGGCKNRFGTGEYSVSYGSRYSTNVGECIFRFFIVGSNGMARFCLV